MGTPHTAKARAPLDKSQMWSCPTCIFKNTSRQSYVVQCTEKYKSDLQWGTKLKIEMHIDRG